MFARWTAPAEHVLQRHAAEIKAEHDKHDQERGRRGGIRKVDGDRDPGHGVARHPGLIQQWKQQILGLRARTGDRERLTRETFAKYRKTPEFRLRNHDMTLAGFKGIFWWEYLHRLLGRVVGVVFLLPFLYFLARATVRGALAWKLAGIFVLGALQGALGWYMVKSGLVDDPRVSSVRLAAHLGLAFLVYAALGAGSALAYRKLSPSLEPSPSVPTAPLQKSRGVVLQLAALFSLDVDFHSFFRI